MTDGREKGGLEKVLGADTDGKVYSSTQKKKKVKREGHDQLIAKLTPPGTTIRLSMMSGVIMVGELAGSDRFTISLRECVMLERDADGEVIGQKLTNEDRHTQIVYKHGIESFNLHVHGDRNKTHGPDDNE